MLASKAWLAAFRVRCLIGPVRVDRIAFPVPFKAVITKGGKLGMPPRVYTLNYEQAVESLQRLRTLRFDTACFGHGPCITQGADRKIIDFLDTLS